MRRAAVLLVPIAALALAGCGGGGGSDADEQTGTTDAAASSTAQAAAAANTLEPLCIRYCTQLQQYEEMCQFDDPAFDLMQCQTDLAAGIDLVGKVEDGLAVLDRKPMSPVDNVMDAIDRARAAYDTWDDDSECGLIALEDGTELARASSDPTRVICEMKATTAAMTIATVGIDLDKATEATT